VRLEHGIGGGCRLIAHVGYHANRGRGACQRFHFGSFGGRGRLARPAFTAALAAAAVTTFAPAFTSLTAFAAGRAILALLGPAQLGAGLQVRCRALGNTA
jgi:hypothetical protein